MKFKLSLYISVLVGISSIFVSLTAQQVEQPVSVQVRFDFSATSLGMMPTHEPNHCTISLESPHIEAPAGAVTVGGAYQGSGPNSIFDSKQIQLPVGRKLTIGGSSMNIEEWEMLVVPPPGYTVLINGVPSVYQKFVPGGSWDQITMHSFEITVLPDSFEGLSAGETTEPEIGRFIWHIGLGYAVNGNPSGLLSIREHEFDEIHKRENLRLTPGPNVPLESYSDSTGLRRVRTDILVDITDVSSSEYHIKFYGQSEFDPNQPLDASEGDLINGLPWRTIKVRKDGSIIYLEVFKGDSGSKLTHHEVEYFEKDDTLLINAKWLLSSGVSSILRRITHDYQNTNKTEAIIEVWNSDYTELARRSRKVYQTVSGILDIQVREGAYGTKDYRTEYIYNSNTNWLQSVQYSNGKWERYTHDYFGRTTGIYKPFKNSSTIPSLSGNGNVFSMSYDQSPAAGSAGAANAFAAVQLWDDYEYYNLPTEILETLAVSGRVVSRAELSYDKSDSLNGKSVLETSRIDFASASESYTTVSRQYTRFLFGNDQLFSGLPLSEEFPDGTKTVWLHQPGDYSPGTSPNALHDFTPSANYDSSNRYWRTIIFHGHVSSTPMITAFGSGPNNSIDPVFMERDKSTVEVIVRGAQGKVVRREVHFFTGSSASGANIPSNYTLVDWSDYQYDPQEGYVLLNVVSGNTKPGFFDMENTYLNGRLHTSKSEDGQVFQFQYDGLGRIVQESLLNNSGIPERSTLYWYNAAGDNVARAHITGSVSPLPSDPSSLGASIALVSRQDFDTGGRIVRREDENGVELRYDYLKIGSFYRQIRREQDVPHATNPSATSIATRIQQFYLDGGLQSITGTAQVPKHFDYLVDINGVVSRRESWVSSGNSRWQLTKSDWLGREIEVRSPGIIGGDQIVTMEYYGSGQGGNSGKLRRVIRPGSNPAIFEYNLLGEMSRQGLDYNNDNSLTLNSLDRITDHETKLVNYLSSWFLESSVYGYPNDNSSIRILLSRSRERLTGFATESVPHGDPQWKRFETYIYNTDSNTSTTAFASRLREFIDPATRSIWSSETLRGESNSKVSFSQNGRLLATRSEAGVRTEYEYDDINRLRDTTTRSNGAAKVIHRNEYYPNSTRVQRTLRTRSTANPNTLVAEYHYYINGRIRSIKNADNRFTYNLYNSRGQLTYRWGDATTPVSFEYNSYGEQIHMRTYTSSSASWSSSGFPSGFALPSSLTKWVYHGATGLLTEKQDPLFPTDSTRKETYTYDNAHRLHVKTRARGVSITHNYHPQSGELSGKVYSDTTPNLSFTYNRLGALRTVNDATGLRTFNYRSLDQQLDYVALPSGFYGSNRRLTTTYNSARRVKNGVRFGTSLNNQMFYRSEWTWANARITQVNAFRRNMTTWRAFAYNFAANSNLVSGYQTTGVNGQTYSFSRIFRPYENQISEARNSRGSLFHARFNRTFDAMGRVVTSGNTGQLFTGFGGGDGLYMAYGYSANGRLESADAIVYDGADNPYNMESRTFHYSYDPAGNRASAGITSNTTSAYKNVYDYKADNSINTINNAQFDTMSGTVSGSPAIYDNERGQWVPSNEAPKPGFGSVFEHVFDATLNQDTSQAYDRWFWFSNPYEEWQQWVYPSKIQQPQYDKDGNLIYDDYLYYTYDAENRPIEIVRWGVDRIKLKYDYMGRRVETRYETNVGGNWTEQRTRRFLYDGWQMIAEIDATTGVSGLPVTSTYFWGYDISHTFGGAGGIGGLLMVDHDGDRYLPGYDAQGNVVTLVSETTGAMVAGFEYDPYGRIIRMDGATDKIPFRYQSKWDMDYGTEATTQFSWGLVDYGLRFYQPKHGRFINRDPIGEAGGLNLYEAFGGDPLNRWDFLGLWPVRVSVDKQNSVATIAATFHYDFTNLKLDSRTRNIYMSNFADSFSSAFVLHPKDSKYEINTSYRRSVRPGSGIVTVRFFRNSSTGTAGYYSNGTIGINTAFVNMTSMRTSDVFFRTNVIGHEILHGSSLADIYNQSYSWNLMYGYTTKADSLQNRLITIQQLELAEEYQNRSWFSQIFRSRPQYLLDEAALEEDDGEKVVTGNIFSEEAENLDPMGRLRMPWIQSRGFNATLFGQFDSMIDQKLFEIKFPAYASMLREGKEGLVGALMQIDRILEKYELEL